MDFKMNKNKNRKKALTFKVISSISAIFGLFLLSVCLWILIAFTDGGDGEIDINRHEHHENATGNNITPAVSSDAESDSITNSPKAMGFRLLRIYNNQLTSTDRGKQMGDNERGNLNEFTGNLNNDTRQEQDQELDDVKLELEQLMEKFESSWKQISPYFQGSCGLAFILALIQVTSCLAILVSSNKGASRSLRLQIWQWIHVIVAIGLLFCFAMPVTIDKSSKDGGIREHLELLLEQLRKLERDLSKDALIVKDDVNNMALLYTALLADSIGIILIVMIGYFVMRFCIPSNNSYANTLKQSLPS